MREIDVRRASGTRFVWVEPNPDIYRVLDTIHRPGTCRAVAEVIRSWQGRNALEFWGELTEQPPREPVVALAALFVRFAWSWKGEGKHFAEQRTLRDTGQLSAEKLRRLAEQTARHTVSQPERLRLSTLADRLERHASAPWPRILILCATAGEATQVGVPQPGDHVNVDRSYAGSTKYPGGHSMPDDELTSVCRWALRSGASVSVYEGRDLSAWLGGQTGATWRAVNLRPSRRGADPRFSKTGEWLMLSAGG